MRRRTCSSTVPLMLAIAVVASSCRDATHSPLAPDGRPSFWADQRPANFRLTGGGRIDKPYPQTGKNTPDSRDFATFGFQARPTGPNTTEGSGNITWVEHNPGAIGGGFTFHGTVTGFFAESDPDCATFTGTGSAQRRDGIKIDNLSFVAENVCDKGEPGVGRDYISMNISDGAYTRNGLLTGGNIQKHKL